MAPSNSEANKPIRPPRGLHSLPGSRQSPLPYALSTRLGSVCNHGCMRGLGECSCGLILSTPASWKALPSWLSGAPTPASFLLAAGRSEEHTSELQSLTNLVCRLLLE